jgi:hypothetical protein
MSVPYCPTSHTTRRPRMLHMHACIMHCLHRLIPTGHEAMTFGERKAWLPFALVMSLSLLRPTAAGCDCDRSSSPSPVSISRNFLSKHLLWFCLTERGNCMHSHSHRQSLDHLLYYLSISAWAHGCSLSERVSVSSPWIQRSPTFTPGGRGKERGNKKKNLVRYDHPRSRGIDSTQLPETGLLSLGISPVLSFFRFT